MRTGLICTTLTSYILEFNTLNVRRSSGKQHPKGCAGRSRSAYVKVLERRSQTGCGKAGGGVFVGQHNISLIRQLAATSDPEDPACRRTHAAAAAAGRADTLSQPVNVC